MSTNKYKIVVQKGYEHLAIEENMYDESLFFYDAYKQGKKALEEIVSVSHVLEKRFEAEHGRPPVEFAYEKLSGIAQNRINSVIAFCANRGYGKTSALLSFIRGLRDMDKHSAYWQDSIANSYRFHFLDTIDPTSMETNDSLLKVVLARMFSKFTETCHERGRGHATGYGDHVAKVLLEQTELEALFLKCFYGAEALHNGGKNTLGDMEDMYDHITEKGDSASLRSMLYHLVLQYLKFMYPDQKGFLVIAIDDADLNTDRVYGLLEEIRKYLMLPRVIILMAANLEQLECTVEQYFIKVYETSLKQNGSMVDIERCHSIAERYMDKSIPANHRIHLPDINKTIQEQFTKIWIDYQQDGMDLILNEQVADPHDPEWNYQQQLLYYLHRKTGMMFLAPEQALHRFLPGSMRDLIQFMAFFEALPDVKCDYQQLITACAQKIEDGADTLADIAQWRNNLDRTLSYLTATWSVSNMRVPSRLLYQEFIQQPEEKKYSFLLKALPEYFGSEQAENNVINGNASKPKKEYVAQFIGSCKKQGIIMDTLSADQSGQSATYADVTTALNILEQLSDGRQDLLVNAIHLYFSIYFHKLLLHNIENLQLQYQKQGHRIESQEEGTVGSQEEADDVFKLGITQSLRDGFFRGCAKDDTDVPIFYWRLTIPGERLKRIFQDSNRQDMAWLAHFLRKRDENGHSVAMATDEKSHNLHFDDHAEYDFHPLYPVLYEIDNLANPSQTKKSLQLVSLVIALNWDVQKQFMSLTKRSDTNDTQTGEIRYIDSEMLTILSKLAEKRQIATEIPKFLLAAEAQDGAEPQTMGIPLVIQNESPSSVELITLAKLICPGLSDQNKERYHDEIRKIDSLLRAIDGDGNIAELGEDGDAQVDLIGRLYDSMRTCITNAQPIDAIAKKVLSSGADNEFSSVLKEMMDRFNIESSSKESSAQNPKHITKEEIGQFIAAYRICLEEIF